MDKVATSARRRTPVELRRGGATLRGETIGSGPAVLLLHAGAERRTVWRPVAERLASEGLRAIAFDQRGHGESGGAPHHLEAFGADAAAMIRREPEVVVVGSSLGGMAAIAALADDDAARRIAGIVLVDVIPGLDPIRVRPWLAARGLVEGRFELVEDILRSGAGLRATLVRDARPLLLVRAGEDSPLSDSDVEGLARVCPRLVTERIAGASHLVARDAPGALAAVLVQYARGWLAREESPATEA